MRDPRYFAGLIERFGYLPDALDTTGAGSIWFHAVSVGEVLSVVELLRALRAERPHLALFVSTSTLAGRTAAEQRLRGLANGIFYCPLDYRSMVRRVLRRLCPALVVIIETEIWPNLYRETKRAGASLLVVNGRISEKALPRYKSASGFFRHVLRCPDGIFVQTPDDAKRYAIAGAPAVKIKAVGNLKYDFRPSEAGIAPEIQAFLTTAKQVFIAASTMPPADASDIDEDDAVIGAFREIAWKYPSTIMVLAPRKPERFDMVARKLESADLSFARRTQIAAKEIPSDARVLLLDSVGELAAMFARADVVFMGGTLARRGGHNILEPAFFGKPVIAGPHMENFAEIAREFTAAHALERIPDARALESAIEALLNDEKRAQKIGHRAQALATSKRGVVLRLVREILRSAAEGVPCTPRTLAARLFLTPLSWLWTAGHRSNLRRAYVSRKALHTRVVSIGGLTMGGTGKTPLVEHIAERLAEQGKAPAILTRGYRKKSSARMVVAPRGSHVPVDLTGDEAQIFVRGGAAHVGIGSNRFEVGERIERELQPDVFLLDDGFQHVQLKRDEDIALIDALDPLAGGIFPLGRRRESLSSLRRATAIVITRVDQGQEVSGLERLIRRYNRTAPIFRSSVVPTKWIDLEWGAPRDLSCAPFRRVAAFCALGSPTTFWRTLEELGLELVFRWSFRDHHAYRPTDIQRLTRQAIAAGAEALVTTEKDSMNLREGTVKLAAPQKIYWLKIGLKIDREEELLARILPRPSAS